MHCHPPCHPPPQGSGNLEAIHIIKKTGGTLHESFLDEGFILDKKIGVGQPKRIENARILVANTPMDTDKIKIYGARVRVDSMAKVGRAGWTESGEGRGGRGSGGSGQAGRSVSQSGPGLREGPLQHALPFPCQVAEIEAAEKDKMRAKVRSIIDHGINCFVNRQLIYNLPEEMFADAGGKAWDIERRRKGGNM